MSWCSITTNYKIVLSFMIRCFDILIGCNSALIRIRLLHPDPVEIRIRPDLTVMDPVRYRSSRILKYGIWCTSDENSRVITCNYRWLLSDGSLSCAVSSTADPIWHKQRQELHRGGGPVPRVYAAQARLWPWERLWWAEDRRQTGATVQIRLVH